MVRRLGSAGAALDGDRSVRLPLASGRWLKIKGAGLKGGPLDFTRFRETGPKALWFDFDGRVAEDVAMGHDAAHPGGCSFQQAIAEWEMARQLQVVGEPVLPCLGYGRISRGSETSWFSLHAWEAHWPRDDLAWPDLAGDLWMVKIARMGEVALRLARDHGLIGYLSFVQCREGWVIKDLHPFRRASPLNMSQVSFVMALFHALHIVASDTRLRSQQGPRGVLPPDVQTLPFRAALPDVTLADHRDAVERILLPYMLKPGPGFRVETLVSVLRSNRITARLMDLVPPDYARFD